MLYVTDLGKIVLASSCVALHCGKPVVYTDGYSIKRPVFNTTSSVANTFTTTTNMKQSAKVIFACKEQEKKEKNTETINESTLSPQVVTNNPETSTSNSSEMSDVYFTAHISFDATLEQPTFTVTRSDQPEVKKYVCSHNPNKAWKAALCDVLHDFPDRVPQMTFAVEEKGVFTRGINCLGLHLSDISRALQDLPRYHDLIALWEANKNKNANSQVSVTEMEQQEASSNTSNNLNTSVNDSDNAYIVVNSQTSTMSVNSTNTPSLHKRGRTEQTSERAKQRKVSQGASRTRGSKSKATKTTTAATSTSKRSKLLIEGNNINISIEHRPSLSLTCAVCGLTNTPFCAVTGTAHASISSSTSSTSDATNNTSDKPVCIKCGLNSVFCPVTGIPHTMESSGNNINQIMGSNDDSGALSAEGQRQGRKRGEVRLPKNATRNIRRNRRLVKSTTHSGDVVAEIKDELLQPRQRKSRKTRTNKETLAATTNSNNNTTTNVSSETTEMYIKDDDNDSSDNATHDVEEEQEEEDLPLCDINLSCSNKDERIDDGANNKTKSRKRSRPVSVKSTQERTPRASSRTSMESVHASQSKSVNRTRSKSRQSKTPSRSLPLSQQIDKKDINTNVENSSNITTVAEDAVNVNRSQDKVIDTFNVAQDAMAVSANSTIDTVTEKSKHQKVPKADLENAAELEEMPLADLMLQEVYVYPPLKSPLPQSEQTKAATILQQRWRAEFGSVLLPPQHETLLLPMLTTRKNVNTNQSSITAITNTNTFTNMTNTVVQPAKRGRRKMKTEENNTDNTNINEKVNGEIKDEITNNDADNKPNNNEVDNAGQGEVDTENKVTDNTNDKADGDTSEAATMPSSPLQNVSSPTSTNTDNVSNAATLMYPLQINNTATSVAVRRYLNFLWQYTSERTKQEALKTMTTTTAIVKDDSENATVPRKTRRNAKSKSENKQTTEELNEVKTEGVSTDVTDFIDDVIKNEIVKTETREKSIEPMTILDDHAMTVTPDAAEVTETTL